MNPSNSRIPVLFLLMEFAPVNTTGNFRNLKILKYIQNFNIDPIVITFNVNQASLIFNANIDHDLLNQLPSDLPIYRIEFEPVKNYKSFFLQFLKIYFSFEDELAKRWTKNLMLELPKIIEKHHPKAIFTTLPPFSCGMLAANISKKFNLPLTIDMRDLWAGWSSTPKNSYFHYLKTLKTEANIFKIASKIIGVTPQLINTFNDLHKNKFCKKFIYIPNGFDKNLNEVSSFKSIVKNKFVIGYVGSFYYNPKSYQKKNFISKLNPLELLKYQPIKEDWLYRTPYFFFKAINKLITEKPEFKSRIRIEFIGKTFSWLSQMVNDFNLQDYVHYHGFVDSSKSLEIQSKFDYFLATSEKVFSKQHYCLPSKIFDYIGASKPIIGFVTEGIQKEFIEKSNLGRTFDIENDEIAALQLESFFNTENWFNPNIEYLQNFHRETIAKNVASVLFSSIN